MRKLTLALLLLAIPALSLAGTYTAATCNYSDVNALVNGPAHTAVNGDAIVIPPGSCTWTSTLNVATAITITGSGTANTGSSTFGAGNSTTVIIENVGSKYTPLISSTGLTYGQTFVVELLDIEPASGSAQIGPPIEVNATCTSSGCGQVRIDNIYFGKTTAWTSANGTGSLIIVDNAFGVADHNSTNPGMNGILEFINPMLTSYLGVGTYGDNSWAQPDTFGTGNEFYIENNVIYTGATVSEGEFSLQSNTAVGGGRIVGRFNQVNGTTPQDGAFSFHGLDTAYRSRGGRTIEAYGNTFNCTLSNCGEAPVNFRAGTGFSFGNTFTSTGGGAWNSSVNANIYRTVYGTQGGWGYCGGNAGDSPTNSVYDTNSSSTFPSGSATSVSNGGLTLTDTSKTWTTNQWHPGAGTEYSIEDITQHFYSQITGNTSNAITIAAPISESGWTGFNSGDTYQIFLPINCVDQAGRGQGGYVSGVPPSPASSVGEALDPIYTWDNTSTTSPKYDYAELTFNGLVTYNRDYYSDLANGSPHAQTSATSPFTGSATVGSTATPGVGFGTLANRPASCTAGVGYFATDQGNWNKSGNSFGQGVLYTCGASNTWTAYYTPYTYPHPLTTPGPAWPIKISSNGRYFEDANSNPWIMNCDAAHAMIGGVATSGYPTYFSSRESYGFNCTQVFGSTLRFNTAGSAYDGTLPFNTGSGPSSYDLSTPNTTYWGYVHSFCSQAQSAGMACALNPLPGQYYDCNGTCNASGSGPAFANNQTVVSGHTKVYNFAAWLAGQLSDLNNVIWYVGDDCGQSNSPSGGGSFQCNASYESDFVNGLLSAYPNTIVMFEGAYFYSYSNMYASSFSASSGSHWSDLLYTYYETYGAAKAAYASSPTSPCFLGEANYEGGNNTNDLTMAATAYILRMQNWWTVTSGCIGGWVWGNASVNHNDSGYPASLTTAATGEVGWTSYLLSQYNWWTVVPDSTNSILTGGYGTSATNNENLFNATYATGTFDAGGTVGFVYTPVANSPVINLAHFSGPVTAKWYDPSDGATTAISGSPFTNSGSHTFTTPGNNNDGNPDWVLVLTATHPVVSPVPSIIVRGGATMAGGLSLH
jgi:hypothetical protein